MTTHYNMPDAISNLLYRLEVIAEGTDFPVKKAGRSLRFSKKELLDWMDIKQKRRERAEAAIKNVKKPRANGANQ